MRKHLSKWFALSIALALFVTGIVTDQVSARETGTTLQKVSEAVIPDDFENDLWLQDDFEELKVGDEVTIYPRRVPQIVSSSTSSEVMRPNFHFEVIEGAENISLSTTTSDDKTRVKAIAPGKAIVKVTYDSMVAYGVTYGAVSAVNTAYVVYQVTDETSDMEVSTGINLTSYDTVYYTEGATTDYKFTPSVIGGAISEVTCNGQKLTAKNGEYIAPLENRSNIIGVTAKDDKNVEKSVYQVVDARKINVVIANQTHPGQSIKVGDKVTISFKGITMPVYKLAKIYNPTTEWIDEQYPEWNTYGTYVSYTNDDLGEVKGKCKQFDLATTNTITVTVNQAGTYQFKKGHIYTSWYGWGEIGEDKREEGTPDHGATYADTFEGTFSLLPDFSFQVGKDEPLPQTPTPAPQAATPAPTVAATPTAAPVNKPVVKKVKATKVKLNKKKLTLKKNKTYKLKATIKPAKSTDKLTWKTSNKKVVKVYQTGKIKAKKKGKAIITVKTTSGKKAKCIVKVK